uniref:Odorant receptor n=1 Tax=Dendrolimus houi TaxID=765132 RepID=A0A076EDD2_9NEOP|nr:odorant receptor [Dendrolimus houi]
MDILDQYSEDYSKNFRLRFKFLHKASVRFFEIKKTWWQMNGQFFIIIPLLIFQFVTMWIYIYNKLSQVQIYEIAYLLPPFLVAIQGFIKAIVILPNRDKINTIIKVLGEMWRAENLTRIQKKDKAAIFKKLNIYNSVSLWINVVGTSQYLLTPLIETVVRRLILNQDCEMLLPLYCAYPFDFGYNWVAYLGVYALQLFSMILWVFFYTGPEWILVTICALIGSQMILLRDDICHMKPVTNSEINGNVKRRSKCGEIPIYVFVNRHQKLIMLCQQLDEVFNRMIFASLLFVGITTCFFRYAGQFSRGPTYMLNNYAAVFASLLQVLHLCYYGELLTGASISIGEAGYQNPWYKGGTTYQKTICFIIKRSQTPCSLTSMRYAQITLSMFTKVISTTWSYLSLMNNVYAD